MYFPYLRGRQFELIALRELVEKLVLSPDVIPVIEPVSLSPTLLSTLRAFINQDRNVIVIHNPQVGKFLLDLSRKGNESRYNDYRELLENDHILTGHIMNVSSEEELDSRSLADSLVVFIDDEDHLAIYNSLFANNSPLYTFVPYKPAFRRRIINKDSLVLLEDRFPKKERNKDYCNSVDNSFSSDHLYFEEEGYNGFSDYSIVGDEFSESGFLPHAVVIHMVYFGEDMELRVHHYVSDSNEDYEDPAGKFSEALQKLITCPHLTGCNTLAMQQFKEYHEQGTYPGLGVLKKLSIMHHLELIGQYLDKGRCL